MILKLYNCDNTDIDLSDNVVVLEIERATVFKNVLLDFLSPTFPAREAAILDTGELLKASDMFCIVDFIGFDINSRTLLSKIYKYIEKDLFCDIERKIAIDSKIHNLANDILRVLYDIDIDFDISGEIDFKDILSAFHLSPLADKDSILDKLLQYVNIVAELKLYKVLVLVHAKSYLMADELAQLYKQCLYKKVSLVLLESHHQENLLENEQKVFIDSEYCDIIIK